jgi:hypothetical protein
MDVMFLTFRRFNFLPIMHYVMHSLIQMFLSLHCRCIAPVKTSVHSVLYILSLSQFLPISSAEESADPGGKRVPHHPPKVRSGY